MKRLIGIISAVIIFTAAVIGATLTGALADVKLLWNYGADDISGFIVGYGPASMCDGQPADECLYPTMVSVPDPTAREFTIEKSVFGEWPTGDAYFRVAAFKDATVAGEAVRLTSVWSNEVSASILILRRPGAPATLAIGNSQVVIIK